jgi:peptide/nickel transport system ATP-binding protein/oligopeptide transport system ATP-binding protein
MKDLQKKFDHTYLFISHDLDVVRIMADRIAVMYLGRLVEIGETGDIYDCAKHPYTQALLSAATVDGGKERIVLKGETSSPIDMPAGCRFHTRCPRKRERCTIEEPELVEVGRGHYVACHLV